MCVFFMKAEVLKKVNLDVLLLSDLDQVLCQGLKKKCIQSIMEMLKILRTPHPGVWFYCENGGKLWLNLMTTLIYNIVLYRSLLTKTCSSMPSFNLTGQALFEYTGVLYQDFGIKQKEGRSGHWASFEKSALARHPTESFLKCFKVKSLRDFNSKGILNLMWRSSWLESHPLWNCKTWTDITGNQV